MKNVLFRRPSLVVRGIAFIGAGLMWGFMPGLTLNGAPLAPVPRRIVGLVIIGIGATMSIVGIVRRS